MPNITMEDFVDECLTGKKPKRKKRRIKESKTDVSQIFEKTSVVDSSAAKDKTDKEDVDNKKIKNKDVDIEQTKDDDKVILKITLLMNDEKKTKEYTKKTFDDDVLLDFQSILIAMGYDMDQLKLKESDDKEQDQKSKFSKLRLIVKEFVTSGTGTEKVELSWKRIGNDTNAVENAEVITSNGSMPFNDNPDPLAAAVETFDRIYYDDIISKVREKLEMDKGVDE